ncbi:MAG: response regulator [Bacteroidales bacterium]|nr:response regulator [Bacteroidales bacterium]
MKIANSLIAFCSFNIGEGTSRDTADRLIQYSITALSTMIVLLIIATLSLIHSDLTTGSIIAAAFISTAIFLSVIVSKKQIKTSGPASAIILGAAFLTALYAGNNGTLILWGVLLYPVFAMLAFEYAKGNIMAIGFGVILSVILFLPTATNKAIAIDLSIKIIALSLYPIILFAISLLHFYKVKRIQDTERLLLEQKNESKLRDEYLAKLSHQIRTPLNNVMIISNMLTSAPLEEKYKDMVDTIQASTNNLVNVLNSMVEISSGDIQSQSDFNISFNLANTINNTIKLFAAQSQTVNFNVKVDENLPNTLLGDPVKLKQIFLNIIENIIKNKNSNKIGVEIKVNLVHRTANSLELFFEVRSNNPLLLKQNEGYTQSIIGENSITSASNQLYIDLLDLNITKKLVQSNGGKLNIKLTSNDAAINFNYKIQTIPSEIKSTPPVVEKEPQIGDKASDATPEKTESTRPAIDLSNANVLLVEDNLINQKIVILSLKKIVKNIEVANNGKEALDKFGTSKYDIILMDIQMPIMNGYVTTKKIREIESSTNSHTPIIAITANALLGDREECISAGMDDYISKPFQIEVLIQKMRNLLKA